MELGNAVFGNSRGSFHVPRGDGWEEELMRLFDAYAPDRDSSWREYGAEYKNNTFEVMEYYWGDCDCGYDDKEYAWTNENDHREDCYQKDYHKIKGYQISKEHDKWLAQKLKPLYEKYGWNIQKKKWWHGCAVRCSCDYNEKWATFCNENEHDKECHLVKPNFLYKPTDFRIQWYKYPLRDSYMNREISLGSFSRIIDDCIASCGTPHNTGGRK